MKDAEYEDPAKVLEILASEKNNGPEEESNV